MKKILSPFAWVFFGCVTFWGLIFACSVFPAPFLSIPFCVPASLQVTSFQLQFEENEPFDIPAVTSCGSIGDLTHIQCGIGEVILCFDMGQLAEGPFYVKAMAKNTTDHSPYGSVMRDIKIIPGSLKGTRIKKD